MLSIFISTSTSTGQTFYFGYILLDIFMFERIHEEFYDSITIHINFDYQ
jgi:hypothetical protein